MIIDTVKTTKTALNGLECDEDIWNQLIGDFEKLDKVLSDIRKYQLQAVASSSVEKCGLIAGNVVEMLRDIKLDYARIYNRQDAKMVCIIETLKHLEEIMAENMKNMDENMKNFKLQLLHAERNRLMFFEVKRKRQIDAEIQSLKL